MEKIPVGVTVAQAWQFTLNNFLAILGTIWLPWILMMAVLMGLLMPEFNAIQTAATNHNPSAVGHFFIVLVPTSLAMLALMSMQLVGIAERAFGQREGPQYFYFSLGKPVLRYITSLFLFILVMIGVLIGCIIAITVTSIIVGAIAGTSAVGAIVALTVLIIYGAGLYFMARLLFLMLPVAVIEGRVSIWRAWQLSRRNFWRIFAVMICILLPLGLVEVATFGVFGMPPSPPPNATPEQAAATQAAVAAWTTGALGAMQRYWYVVYPLSGLFSAALYGFIAASQVFAYRALIPDHNVAETFS